MPARSTPRTQQYHSVDSGCHVHLGTFYLPRAQATMRGRSSSHRQPVDPVASGQRMTPGSSWAGELRSPRRLAGAPHGSRRPFLANRFRRDSRPTRDGVGDIISLGDGSTAQKSTLRCRRTSCSIASTSARSPCRAERGIALNSSRDELSAIPTSPTSKPSIGFTAIPGWNGPGDYIIENDCLEAASKCRVRWRGPSPT